MSHFWRDQLLGQLDFYWNAHLRPRLDGMTDDEYFWEPADNVWTLREIDGKWVAETNRLTDNPPVTTIAWRMIHIGRDNFARRARAFFGPTPAPDDADMFDERHSPEPLPTTANDAVAFLEQAYAMWRDGAAEFDDEKLREALGPKGGPFADDPWAALMLHVNRETLAHGAEICLLRDLYREQARDTT